jgi:hypothetical protein
LSSAEALANDKERAVINDEELNKVLDIATICSPMGLSKRGMGQKAEKLEKEV